jgi:hypothetical protein
MITRIMVLSALLFACGVALTNDAVSVIEESQEERSIPDASTDALVVGPVLNDSVKSRILDAYDVVDLRPVMHQAGPLTPTIGEPAKWVIEHLDSLEGWSLTGWSKSGMFDCGNLYRCKIGIINGDLEASRVSYIIENEHLIEFQEWERQLERDPVFGVSLTVLF